MGNAAERIKGNTDKVTVAEPLNDALHAAERAGQALMNEVQKDWKSGCSWVKSHPKEDALIAGGALIIGGVALSAKDQRDGARAISEGNKLLQDEQVVAETTAYGRLGSDSFLTTKLKYGDHSEASFWLDPQSAQGRRWSREHLGGTSGEVTSWRKGL